VKRKENRIRGEKYNKYRIRNIWYFKERIVLSRSGTSVLEGWNQTHTFSGSIIFGQSQFISGQTVDIFVPLMIKSPLTAGRWWREEKEAPMHK
jgi:hypothetical protein